MADISGSALYGADLWDLQSAMVETNKTQERPMPSDLEDLFFDCGDVLMQDHEILTPGPSIKTPETGSDEVRIQKEGAQALWLDYDMGTVEPMMESEREDSEKVEVFQKIEPAHQPMRDYNIRMTEPMIGLGRGTYEQAETVQEAEEAQHQSEESEPEYEEGQTTQKSQATERKQEYKRKFDKW